MSKQLLKSHLSINLGTAHEHSYQAPVIAFLDGKRSKYVKRGVLHLSELSTDSRIPKRALLNFIKDLFRRFSVEFEVDQDSEFIRLITTVSFKKEAVTLSKMRKTELEVALLKLGLNLNDYRSNAKRKQAIEDQLKSDGMTFETFIELHYGSVE